MRGGSLHNSHDNLELTVAEMLQHASRFVEEQRFSVGKPPLLCLFVKRGVGAANELLHDRKTVVLKFLRHGALRFLLTSLLVRVDYTQRLLLSTGFLLTMSKSITPSEAYKIVARLAKAEGQTPGGYAEKRGISRSCICRWKKKIKGTINLDTADALGLLE
jgi:hypothetical protein